MASEKLTIIFESHIAMRNYIALLESEGKGYSYYIESASRFHVTTWEGK